jgi:hypothetical protein
MRPKNLITYDEARKVREDNLSHQYDAWHGRHHCHYCGHPIVKRQFYKTLGKVRVHKDPNVCFHNMIHDKPELMTYKRLNDLLRQIDVKSQANDAWEMLSTLWHYRAEEYKDREDRGYLLYLAVQREMGVVLGSLAKSLIKLRLEQGVDIPLEVLNDYGLEPPATNWLVVPLDEESQSIRLGGTTGWGTIYQIINAPSGDPIGVDARYVGFFLNEKDARDTAAAVNALRRKE